MARKANGHGRVGHNSGGSLWLHRSYNNVEKDPEVDRFRTIFQGSRIKEADLAVLAGLAGSTVKNMFGGKTRRPQHTTFGKMAGALGYKYDLVPDHDVNFDKEIPRAREQRRAYYTMLAKKRERKSSSKSHRG
jgi:transcriptional regulator with XRE-family HTH domain